MRENRQSGSEGGATQPNESSLPLCAFASLFEQKGGSPFQVDALRPVVERYCVAARRGGKLRETKVRSATKVNSIRPCRVASLQSNGEARTGNRRPER